MKKLLATLLVSAMALSAVGGLVACDEEPVQVDATGITLNRTEMSLVPDGSKGVVATLAPANATTEIKWTSSNEAVATVNNGYVQGWDTGTAVITAEANGHKASFTVTVGDWARYVLVGTINSWNATGSEYVFQQDATDKHKWTITMDLEDTDEFKFVPAVKGADGTWAGGGWSGDFGTKADDALGQGENNKVTGTEGTIVVGPGNTQNIKVENPGNYTFTLKMKVGGGVDSFSYVRNGDVTPAA